MNYFATHYWQAGEGSASALVLQQAYHKRRKIPILLAGIEEREPQGEILCQSLMEWFYGDCLSLCDRHGEKKKQAMAESLSELWQAHLCPRFAGVFCVGEDFWIFRKGDQNIYLINTRNNRAECRRLFSGKESEAGEWDVQTGKIQPGVGLLLATEDFYSHVPDSMLKNCLDVRGLKVPDKANAHLRELGTYAGGQGGTDIGAILIVAH